MPSQRDDCLFCGIVRDGTYVAQTKGFVAINDIHPQAPVHLLIIPEHHVDSFREVGEFSARESKRMLEFVAETARDGGSGRLQGAGERRAERGTDRLPSPLARAGRARRTRRTASAMSTAVSEL